MARIFLSYAREDETQVRDVYRRLLDVGFDGWMDKIDLLPGQRWQQEIPHAIRNSDFILIFFSKHSVAKRGYIQSEFRLVLDTLGYLLALLVTSANEQDRHQVAALSKPLQEATGDSLELAFVDKPTRVSKRLKMPWPTPWS